MARDFQVDPLRWGILSTGFIAHKFAEGVLHSKTGRLAAVASRNLSSAEKFRETFSEVGQVHGSYEELFANPEVEAVYVAPPHPFHLEWTLKAIAAGKHVLCEKPIGMNSGEARKSIEAANEAGVFLMEAYMYRCAPQTKRLLELVREDAIGRVRSLEAIFCFDGGDDPEARLLNPDLGGGGILDVGGYPVSACRAIAGVLAGEDGPVEPTAVKAVGHLGPTGVDEITHCVLQFETGLVAAASCGVRVEQPVRIAIYGEKGRIVVSEPWIPSREGGTTFIHLTRYGASGGAGETEIIEVTTDEHLYGLEADAFAVGVDRGEAVFPAMTQADTLGNMAVLDQWRSEIGLVYPCESGDRD